MTRTSLRWIALVLPCAGLMLADRTAEAQAYFGRNKVQYETFDWRILRSEHFDNYFYPAESVLVHDAGRMAERWYTRLSDLFRHAFDRKSLIFYADHPDFQQTNVIFDQLQEGVGGVTEGFRTRVIMPFTGVNANDDHVLGHELVHVFQYNIAEGAPGGGLQRLGALPLWVVEGMAEYFSLGRNSPLTAMWMRDAVMRDQFPTIRQLTTDPRFFPYRYGQALWAYVAGRWGDRAVVDVYRTALRIGWDGAIIRVLGINSDSLSRDWAAANSAMYLPITQARTHPDSIGTEIIPRRRSGDNNLSPTLSPDGRLVAFYSSRNLFGIDLFVADAATGRVIKRLGGPASDPHFDAISFINSAGDWSPDGSQFAFIVYAQGDNEIAILNTTTTDVERRIRIPGVGAVTHVSWSPDGRTLAVSGMSGGQSDIFLVDLTAETVRQLTDDRYSDIQPTWSPDGRTIVFVSDRGPETDLATLRFGPLRLSVLDVQTGQVRVAAPFTRGRQINPQFSPDGSQLYFISDQDGVSDIYRQDLASGQVYRLTRAATGISGITEISPALTVSRRTGRMMFTTFYDQGQAIRAFDDPATMGELVVPGTDEMVASVLPPGDVSRSIITAYLGDYTTGLASGADFTVVPFRSRFALDAIGNTGVGVSVGGPFGSGVQGGVAALFGDQLGDRRIYAILQAQGTAKDIGGAAYYSNMRRRWNWTAGAHHIPVLSGGVFVQPEGTTAGGQTVWSINYVLQRMFVDEAMFLAQYPFTMTRRAEVGLSATRLGFETELFRFFQVGNQIIGDDRASLPAQDPVYYVQPAAALVGDNSFHAFTGPVSGGRYRMEYRPTIGTITMHQGLADSRRYFFLRPFTFALRGYHLGRYGPDAEHHLLWPMFLGQETWIRGYWYPFRGEECAAEGGQAEAGSCPVFDRLLGSRVLVGNAEFRIPLLGVREFGMFNFPFLPTELSAFVDGGVAYTSDQPPSFRLTTTGGGGTPECLARREEREADQPVTSQAFYPCAERIPVFSTGVSIRMNLFGYAVLETYFARPFQRPERNWVWGFQIAPGW